AAAGEVVDPERTDVDRDHAAGLHRIDRELRAVRMARCRHFGERHAETRLELDGADGDHANAARKFRLEPRDAGSGVVLEIGERQNEAFESEELCRALPGGDVRGELSPKDDGSIARRPRVREGDRLNAFGRARDQPDVTYTRPDEAGQPLAECSTPHVPIE